MTSQTAEIGSVYDAAEYLNAAGATGRPAEGSRGFADHIYASLACVLIILLSIYTKVRFALRQAKYAFERQALFRHTSITQIRQDARKFLKIPRHVAFILDYAPASPFNSTQTENAFETLVGQLAEVATWSLASGSPLLTAYERTGALQDANLLSVRDALETIFARTFGKGTVPSFTIRSGPKTVFGGGSGDPTNSAPDLAITLTSERNGRPLMAQLAREYAADIARGTLDPAQITVPFVNEQLKARVGDEPDLLVTFGSHLDLQGFSPWHLRVTELYCMPDNNGVVHYLVFYRALEKFSTVKVNLGA